MIKLQVGNNLSRVEKFYAESMTIRQVFEMEDIDLEGNAVYLDSSPVAEAKLDEPLSAFGIAEFATLIAVVKQTNA